MTSRIQVGTLQIDQMLYNFINDEALPGTGVVPEAFWVGFERIVDIFAPGTERLSIGAMTCSRR